MFGRKNIFDRKFLVEKIFGPKFFEIENFSENKIFEIFFDEKMLIFFNENFFVRKLGVQRCRNDCLELYSMNLSELGLIKSKNVQETNQKTWISSRR